MAEEPDRLRNDIERTRASLTRDVDRLAVKTSPRHVAQRRWTAMKEKVMGTTDRTSSTVQDKASRVGDKASDISDKASEKAHDTADAVRAAPQAVATQTQGNPLAAGLIAFGAGLLAATLVPVTDAERRAAQELKDRSGDLTDQVKDVAGEMKDDLSGSVREAAGEVKGTAQEAVQTTKAESTKNIDEVREQVR
jgi:uncharacterized protein YjbJ (UPF0337 family)